MPHAHFRDAAFGIGDVIYVSPRDLTLFVEDYVI
jgi:hypothetical protein